MNLHPIFDKCTAPERTRYAIDKPWSDNGFIYATDGRVCVRTKGNLPPVDGKTPDPRQLDWDSSHYETTPIDYAQLESYDCKACDKIGYYTCETCSGRGKCHCDCGNTHSCEECGGKGNWPCLCDKGHNYKAGGFYISGRFVALIQEYGALLFDRVDRHPEKSRRFAIGPTIEGLIMPRLK